MESAIIKILSRLFQLPPSPQSLTETKSLIEVISELQQSLPTLSETFNTLRRDLSHIMESNSNNELNHIRNLILMSPEEKQSELNHGPLLDQPEMYRTD